MIKLKNIVTIILCIALILFFVNTIMNVRDKFDNSMHIKEKFGDDLIDSAADGLSKLKKLVGGDNLDNSCKPTKKECPLNLNGVIIRQIDEDGQEPDLSNYILKTEIPPLPDLSKYILKSEIPPQCKSKKRSQKKRSQKKKSRKKRSRKKRTKKQPKTTPATVTPSAVTPSTTTPATTTAAASAVDSLIKDPTTIPMTNEIKRKIKKKKDLITKSNVMKMGKNTNNGNRIKFQFDKILPDDLTYTSKVKCSIINTPPQDNSISNIVYSKTKKFTKDFSINKVDTILSTIKTTVLSWVDSVKNIFE